MTQFSALMPVYGGDEARLVDRALASTIDTQELQPDQVVIVQDGPVGLDLAAVLERWASHPKVTLVVLPVNRGISAALNTGLKACRYPIVARCDADDISLPHRFATQVPLVAGGLDLVGGAVEEIDEAGVQAGIKRQYPTKQSEIERFARLHNPFAHPTVVFRAAVVRQAGGYPHLERLEDYLLWAKLLMTGARVANVERVVVAYRTSMAAYQRRGGWALALPELRLQRTFRAMGFTTRRQAVRNAVLRIGFELAPVRLRQWPLRRALRPSAALSTTFSFDTKPKKGVAIP
jgi:glycosyltransferase involved in cell wall biosynthesis